MSKKKIARILLVLAVVASLTLMELTPLSMVQDASAVTQADIDKLKDELSGMNSEKSQLEKELKSIQNDKSAALAQKENIDKQINLLQSEIKGVESLISEYETLITQTEQEIRENEEEEARQYEKFCERVRSMEERGTVSYWSVLLDSASFSDLLSAMDFISEIMDSDQKVIDDLRALREQIEQKKASLETSLAEQQSAKETLVAKKSELNTQRAEAEKVLAELKANEAQYKQILSEKDAAMERQQAEIKREQDFIQRNKARVATRGMANSRQKKLDKMEVLTKRQEKPKPHFHFQSDRTPSRFVIEAQRLVLGYDTPLTKPVDIKVERNKKIAIRGTNGLGKSTLLKTLLGLIKPVSGDIEHGEFVSVGYFEQEEARGNMNTALEELWQEYPGMTNFEVRAALASCGLTNEHITTKMTALSGGEAAKVRLAKIMQKPVNLLVLDEPTNHLDVEAKKELKRALQEYKGTLLLVSHEPDFYEDLVDTVWNIESWSTKIV